MRQVGHAAMEQFDLSSRSMHSQPYDHGGLLDEVVDTATSVLDLTGAAISLVDEDRMWFVTSNVGVVAELLELWQERHQVGPALAAVTSGDPVCIADLSDPDGPWPRYAATARYAGIGAVAVIPLRAAGDTIGVLALYSSQPRTWSEPDLRIARSLAETSAQYLSGAMTHPAA
ncbi:GAF domain-containing protein [Skermania sp. ID1734]|uniref:GAF domain-containing protein n=1 Tax=Skermania sp. ID1734 TaxID=2597516 RepID=UPI0011812437|nr:GAF domain-containing protein [Skermania sp. ID1734]TSD99823.1 GAF domain-containing protein [Skermania sp. ID1734]